MKHDDLKVYDTHIKLDDIIDYDNNATGNDDTKVYIANIVLDMAISGPQWLWYKTVDKKVIWG